MYIDNGDTLLNVGVLDTTKIYSPSTWCGRVLNYARRGQEFNSLVLRQWPLTPPPIGEAQTT